VTAGRVSAHGHGASTYALKTRETEDRNVSDAPFIVCLCPTYGRPRFVENSIRCYLAQDYPADRRRLLILDDAGQIPAQQGDGWQLFSRKRRFASLPAKYTDLVLLAKSVLRHSPSAYCVWDDDVYLPWHLSAHAEVLGEHGWSHPSKIWATRTGTPALEYCLGQFHGALAVRRDLLEKIGGWPDVPQANFDRRMLRRLAAQEPAGNPTAVAVPSYVFRSGSHPHRHDFASGPGDTVWYYDYARACRIDPWGKLKPEFDEESRKIVAVVAKARDRQYATDDIIGSLLDEFAAF